jgi:hypothetical protein
MMQPNSPMPGISSQDEKPAFSEETIQCLFIIDPVYVIGLSQTIEPFSDLGQEFNFPLRASKSCLRDIPVDGTQRMMIQF